MFQYPYGIRFEKPATRLGSRVHSYAEGLLQGNYALDLSTEEGRILAPGLKHLPEGVNIRDPFSCAVEPGVTMPIPGLAVPFFGKIDVVWYDIQEILDWKTTKNFRYAKSEHELLKDLQFLLYGRWAAHSFKWPYIKGRWIYLRTQGKPAAKCFKPHTTLAHAEKGWEYFTGIAHEIAQDHANKTDIATMRWPNNLSACTDFGGCPFQDTCKHRWHLIENPETRMSELERLMAASVASQPQPTPAPAPLPPMPPPPAQAPAFVPAPAPQPETVAPAFVPAPPTPPSAVPQTGLGHYQQMIAHQPPLHAPDPNRVDDRRCVVCGLEDDLEKAWTSNELVPEFPGGFLVHKHCMETLATHRGKILQGLIPPGTPMAPPQPPTAPAPPDPQFTSEEAAEVATEDDINPPESSEPSLTEKPEEKKRRGRKSAAAATGKRTKAEQARWDAIYCALISAVGIAEPVDFLKDQTDALYEAAS